MKLAEIKALEEAMTPAPWGEIMGGIDTLTDAGHGYPLGVYTDSVEVYRDGVSDCGCEVSGTALSDSNLAGLIAMRNAWPAVVALLEEAASVMDRMKCWCDDGCDICRARDALLARIDGEMEIK